jgi:hypothetical protein
MTLFLRRAAAGVYQAFDWAVIVGEYRIPQGALVDVLFQRLADNSMDVIKRLVFYKEG